MLNKKEIIVIVMCIIFGLMWFGAVRHITGAASSEDDVLPQVYKVTSIKLDGYIGVDVSVLIQATINVWHGRDYELVCISPQVYDGHTVKYYITFKKSK